MSPGRGLTLFVDGRQIDRLAIERATRDTARRLAACGAGPGVGVLAPASSGPAFVVADAAARLVGASLVLRSAFAPPERLPVAAAVVEATGAAICEVRPQPPATELRLPEEAALLCPTSGSTGSSRYAMLTAAGLRYQYRTTADRLEISRRDRLCLPLPLNHAYGYSVLGIAHLTGAQLWLEPGSGIGPTMKRISDRQVTSLDAVPGFYAALLARARDPAARRGLAALRLRGCGGEMLPASVEQAFMNARAPLCNGYGLTEAGPNVAIPAAEGSFGTVGPPLEGVEVRIGPSTGELLVRSPSVALGYFDNLDAPIDAEGWLATGDRAEWHGGDLRILGRLSELIKINGSTVPPAEVEALLDESHPGARFAVAAVTDRRGRRRLGAVVASNESPTLIRQTALRRLPPELRPQLVVTVRELPTTWTGKLDRAQVRRLLQKQAAA